MGTTGTTATTPTRSRCSRTRSRERLKNLASRFDGDSPLKYAAAPSISHSFKFPSNGAVRITWTTVAPSGGGAQQAAAKKVVLARGKRKGKKGATRSVAVRPTKQGRRIMRKAKRLKVTLNVRFVGGAATNEVPAVAKRTFRLKR